MPSPAEIIAARLNRDSEDYELKQELEYKNVDDAVSTTSSTRASTPSITDESAFPALGMKSSNGSGAGAGAGAGAASTHATTNWGPTMKSPKGVDPASLPSNDPARQAANAKKSTFYPKMRAHQPSVQEAFSLDIEDQLNVSRPEFVKILTFVMQETKTSIECTNSQHTKKRTFLITGKPEEVKSAKRLVVKKLTKPISIKFTVPAALRSRIIGQGGKNLKPIIAANEVKIEIGEEEHDAKNENVSTKNDEDSSFVNNKAKEEEQEEEEEDEDDDDIFSKTIQITIDGDVEGAKRAKSQILAIVKEETKNLSTKVSLDERVKPFAITELKFLVDKYSDLDFSIPDYKSSRTSLLIVGERESVLEAKSDVKAALEKLSKKITVEEVPIPQTKHQFLPIADVLEKCNVLIQLPKDGEQNVKFVGEKKNIKLAQDEARKVTSQYKVEVLDMSKAHKGNLKHVRAVAVLLNKTGAFKEIAQTNDVTIHVPHAKELQGESSTTSSIPIQIVSKSGDDKIKAARKAIVTQVNKITPEQTKVIDDIDAFFQGKIEETIKDVAKAENVQYVILGTTITLFSAQQKQDEEADDFDDFETADVDQGAFDKINAALTELRQLAAKLTSESLKASQKEIQVVSGPMGTTLKSILASVEPQTVTVKFNEDLINIHGIDSSVVQVKKEIEAVLAEAKEYPDGYSSTVQVPASVVSRLIGRNGANLNALRDEFGVKIDVPLLANGNVASSASHGKDDGEKVEITVKGVKKNVEEAKANISASAKKWADETLVRLRIEHQYHRRMIGAQGVYINRLQDKYHVKIRFPSADSSSSAQSTFADAPKSKDEVTIKGPSKMVAKAEEELKELYKFEQENGYKETIRIPSKAISRVIGKAGATINDIADGTGVEYKFKRDNAASEEKDGFVEVELTGSKSALKEAKAKIQEIIADVENFVVETVKVDPKYHRDLVGPYGSVMKHIITQAGGDNLPRQKYNRLMSIPNEGSGSDEVVCQGDKAIVEKIVQAIEKIVEEKKATISEDYELAKEKHRFIIGPGGSTRSEIEREFKVQLSIPKREDESIVVKIKGLPESIEKAKLKITELTKDKETKNGKKNKSNGESKEKEAVEVEN